MGLVKKVFVKGRYPDRHTDEQNLIQFLSASNEVGTKNEEVSSVLNFRLLTQHTSAERSFSNLSARLDSLQGEGFSTGNLRVFRVVPDNLKIKIKSPSNCNRFSSINYHLLPGG